MKKLQNLAMLAAALGGIAGFVGAALAAPAAPHVEIGMEQARTIALKVVPGNVIHSELEKENGAWRFSFDIKLNGEMHEVGIDADGGKVVENSLTAPSKRG